MTLRQRFNLLIESLDKGTIEERKHMVMRWVRDFTTEEFIPEDVFADAPQEILTVLLFSFTTQLLQALTEESDELHRHELSDRQDAHHAPAEMLEVPTNATDAVPASPSDR